MSSEVLARAQAFFGKADELLEKGHIVRAAENFGRAAEAARALGPDNLVVVDSQRAQGATLFHYAATVCRDSNTAAVDPIIVTAHRDESLALVSAALEALERRRVAGTLLKGKCTAAEEAWDAQKYVEFGGFSAVEASSMGKLVGYSTFLRLASSGLDMLANADWLGLFEDCSAAQFQAFLQFVVNAAELMQQSRSHGMAALSEDTSFVKKLSDVVDGGYGLEARVVQPLTGAWRRLQQSGVMEARNLLNGYWRSCHNASNEKVVAAIQAAMAAPGLRSCALAGCSALEAHPQHFKRCSACKLVVYCSKEHQLEAWPAHKAACKAARKAAAASADGGGAGRDA